MMALSCVYLVFNLTIGHDGLVMCAPLVYLSFGNDDLVICAPGS